MARMKVKKNNYGIYIAISVVAILTVAGVVGAYTGTSQQVIENVENLVINNSSDDSMLGVRQSDIASGFWDVYVENDLTVDGDTVLSTMVVDLIRTGDDSYNSTTTDDATYTFVEDDLLLYSYLDLDFTAGAAITYTMPATSTMMTLLPSIGSTRTWTIHNASTTGAVTLAAGAGMNLLGIDTNVDTIAADGWATLECMQTVYASATNENIACLMAEYLVAD